MKAKKKPQDRYVYGFVGRGQCVYGKETYTDPMTLRQAREGVKSLHNGPTAIFKLVRVK